MQLYFSNVASYNSYKQSIFTSVANYSSVTFTMLSLTYRYSLALFISYLINLKRGVLTLITFQALSQISFLSILSFTSRRICESFILTQFIFTQASLLCLSFISRTATYTAAGYFFYIVRTAIAYIPYTRKLLSLNSLSNFLRGLFQTSIYSSVRVVACTTAITTLGIGWLRTGMGVLGLKAGVRT